MDIFLILIVLWIIYSLYNNVIRHRDYKYVFILLISAGILSCVIKSRFWWLFLSLLATNLYYFYIMYQNAMGILGQLTALKK